MVDLENGVFMEQVEDLVERKRWPDLRDMLCLLEPADISAILSELPEDRLPLLYRLLPKELAAEVFVEMEPEEQELLIKSFSDTELKEVLEELYVDDTVDIIEEMPASWSSASSSTPTRRPAKASTRSSSTRRTPPGPS